MLVIFVAWSTLVAGQQRQHLLRSLATFSVAKGSVFAEEDRATIEAAIQEWYGGAEAGAGGEDGKGDAGGGGEAGAGGGSKGGAKRDGIAKFEQELHEGHISYDEGYWTTCEFAAYSPQPTAVHSPQRCAAPARAKRQTAQHGGVSLASGRSP